MSRYMIEVWCGRETPDKSYEFKGTRAEARAECKKHYRRSVPFRHGNNQIAHPRWLPWWMASSV